MTLSPRRNILEMKRSLLTGLAFFLPLPLLGTSVHISLTFSKTILQCRSKALTRPSNLRLFRQLIRTWVLFLTDWVNTDSGPVLNSSSSSFCNSSCDISLFGFWSNAILNSLIRWITQPRISERNQNKLLARQQNRARQSNKASRVGWGRRNSFQYWEERKLLPLCLL